MHIPDSELFTDLQVTLTELFIVELLSEEGDIDEVIETRGHRNFYIREAIKSIMRDRFDKQTLIGFLEDGYPRQATVSQLFDRRVK